MNPAGCCAPIAGAPFDEADAVQAAEMFKALCDPARVMIVNLIATAGEAVCPCDLTAPLGLTQPTVSFHLKKLLRAGLLEREQRGKWAFYSLRGGALGELAAALDPERSYA